MVSDNGIKSLVGDTESKSVIDRPLPPRGNNPAPIQSLDSQIYWLIGQYADEIEPWGRQIKLRDAQLRAFVTQENIFASALGIICSRNSGFSWALDGPARTVSALQEKFETANMGIGWHDLIAKTTIDLCTQDNGAFWEIVRSGNSETSSFLGVNHLDSARCWHTGNPNAPVIYQDRLGRYHLLKWYNVIEFAEMPVAFERFYGLQYCVLTRLLRRMQITKNVDVLDYEKTSGRNTRAIHLVKGITSQQLQDAMNQAKNFADSAGLTRYISPVVVGTLDPKADVGHDTIDMVSVPDKYDPQQAFDHYINLIAMAFESDYQEFAPLPGRGLGTGAQSEMLHLKSRGKGPGTFMKMITHAINFRILPKNVTFLFNEQDFEAEKSLAEVKALRAQSRSVRIASGEITPEVARQIANDEGDLRFEYLKLMQEQDVTPDIRVDDASQAATQLIDVTPGVPAPQFAVNQPKPARIPSIRPPTPLGPKMPNNLKELTIANIKENGDALIEAFNTKPYSGADDSSLPTNVRKMAVGKRRQWIAIFNSVLKKTGDEGRAFASANGAVKD